MHHRRFASLAVLSSLLAFGSTVAQPVNPGEPSAAPEEESIQLSVFEVNTSRDIGYLSSNAAEAMRMDTPIADIPMNVSIFNQQFIEDLTAVDTAELLAYEPTTVKTGHNDEFLIRGFPNPGSNFLNGFPQTGFFGSQPLINVERVEVIRGPAAVLYGSGGFGGIINRITKKPQPNPFTHARVILSEQESYRGEFDFNRPLGLLGGDRLMFRVNGAYARGVTWFGGRNDEESIAPSLRWDITPRTRLILEYLHSFTDRPGGWATPVHAGDPRGIVTGDGVYRLIPERLQWISPEDFRHITRDVASFDFRHAFNDSVQFRSQFQYENKVQDFEETQGAPNSLTILQDTALTSRSWRRMDRSVENYRSRNELIVNFETGPVKHRLLLGHGWIEQYDLHIRHLSSRNLGGITGPNLTGPGRLSNKQAGRTFNFFPDLTYAEFLADPNLAGYNTNLMLPINIFNRGAEPPVPVASRPPLHLNTETKTYLTNEDYYFNDVLSFAADRLHVMVGARFVDFETRTINWAAGGFPNKVRLANPPTVERSADGDTWSAGAVWHLNAEKTLTLYGNLNNSFEPEFRTQPDGSALDPLEGNQKEVGLRFTLWRDRISGLVSYFDLLQDNVTRPDPIEEGFFLQESGLRSTGVEFSLNGRITDNWLVIGGYANTDARHDQTGVPVELSPRHRFAIYNRFTFDEGRFKGLSFGLGAIYTGERRLEPQNNRKEPDWGPLPEAWRFDVSIGYKFAPGNKRFAYNASLNVHNILDERIYESGTIDRSTLDTGRVWRASFGVRF